MKNNHQNGFILLTTLILSIIISFALTNSYYYTIENLRISQETIHSRLSFERAKVSSIPHSEQNYTDVRESKYTGKAGKQTQAVTFLTSNKPIVDFNTLLKYPSYCTTKNRRTLVRNTLLSRSLSQNSSSSNYSCTEFEFEKNQSPYSFQSNLDLNYKFITPDKETIIVTSGYFSVSEEIELVHSLTVFAGGDILLSNITAQKNQVLKLYSATGIVIVDNLSSNIKFMVYGRNGVYVPSNIALLPFESNYLLKNYIFGIRQSPL